MSAEQAAPVGASHASPWVVFHTASLAAISFLMSANGTALPQLFYQRFHASNKVLLLAACLFVGTCGSIAGVVASRSGTARAPLVIASLAALFAAEGALFVVTGAIVYAALNACAQIAANYTMNHLDHAATARAGDRHRRLHDGASNAVRLLGMLAAPAIFPMIYTRRAALAAVLAGAFLVAIASAASLFSRAAETEIEAVRGVEARPVDVEDRLLFGFAVTVYVALYLLAANMIYLIRDVLGMADAERRGGFAIVVVFVAALVANASSALLRGKGSRASTGLFVLVAPLPALAMAAAQIARGPSLSYGVLLAGCVGVGLCYGAFLAEMRDRASRGAREEGKTGLLTMFNNMANVSSLIAFALLMAIAASNRDPGARPFGLVLALVGALPWLGLPLLLGARAIATRRARST